MAEFFSVAKKNMHKMKTTWSNANNSSNIFATSLFIAMFLIEIINFSAMPASDTIKLN
jgi:hypothetical protein